MQHLHLHICRPPTPTPHAQHATPALVALHPLNVAQHTLPALLWHAAAGDFALKHASWMVGSQYKPGEVAKMEWATVQQGPPWAVDSWGLGCMMQVVNVHTRAEGAGEGRGGG
jgi:SCY1-like protein 1